MKLVPKDIFFFNDEIATYAAEYNGGNIFLSGDSSFTADSGRIENYGNIDLGDNNLDISAYSFINHSGAIISNVNRLNLTVDSFIDNGIIAATNIIQ